MSDLPNAVSKVVYTPPAGTMYSKQLWAPEIHYLDGKWYLYFAADDGVNKHHRMYVAERSLMPERALTLSTYLYALEVCPNPFNDSAYINNTSA